MVVSSIPLKLWRTGVLNPQPVVVQTLDQPPPRPIILDASPPQARSNKRWRSLASPVSRKTPELWSPASPVRKKLFSPSPADMWSPASPVSIGSSPSPHAEAASSLHPCPVLDSFEKSISQLSAAEFKTSCDRLFSDAFLGQRPRIGSICSGSDMEMVSMSVFLDVLRRKCGSTAESKHIFSCEFKDFKREFLQQLWEPQMCFKDALEMGNDTAHCYVTDAEVEIPVVDILFNGTSCKDYSAQNCKAQGGFFAEDDCGESKSTFEGPLSYIRRHLPKLVIFENVWALKLLKRNHFALYRMIMSLRSLGYLVVTVKVNSSLHGSCQARIRLYIVALQVGYATSDNTALQDDVELLEQQLRVTPCGLSAVLLEEPPMLDSSVLDKSSKQSEHLRWKKDYPPIFASHDIPWPSRRHPLSVKYNLTDREDAVLHFYEGKHPLEQQGDGEDVELEDWVDVSQSLGDRSRYIEKSSTVNTLLPGSKWVMRHRRRVLSGIEALSIQGLHWKSYEAHGTHWKVIRSMFTDRQLCDLAGNAFDANSMLVALVVAMKLCEVSEKATGIPRSLPPVARLTGDPPSPSTSCDDSEGSPESVAGPIPGERFRALELLSNSWCR